MTRQEEQERGQALAEALADLISKQPPPIQPRVLLIALGKVSATCFKAIPSAEREAMAQRWVKQILWLAEHAVPDTA